MKKHFFNATFWAFLSLALWTTGCSDDDGYPDVDGQSPTMTLSTDHIESGVGRRFTIEGVLEDKDGISSINLQCADLDLNKTIDLIEIHGTPKETYDLSYYYDIKKDEIGERFTVKVTVNDVGGRSVSQDVLITMDGDFENPAFKQAPGAMIAVLLKEGVTPQFTLNLSMTDDRGLDYLTIDIEGFVGFSQLRVEAEGKQLFDYSKEFTMPSDKKDYPITITLYDKKGKSMVCKSTISVTDILDFEKMYLADVATVAELNSDIFGVPMRIDHIGACQYKAKYYCQKANTEIFFIPQKTEFAPVCFGLDPEDETQLINDTKAKPFILKEANVYYEITFDILYKTYEIKTYPISTATNRLPQAIGSDYYLDVSQPQFIVPFQIGVLERSGNTSFSADGPGGVVVFKQDATNPNLFYTAELDLESGKDNEGKDKRLSFIIHNKHDWGWWDYCLWRLDNETEPEMFIYGGADAKPKPQDISGKPVIKSGTYKFWFDAHLERGKLVKVK